MDYHEESYESNSKKTIKEKISDFMYHLPCLLGLHEVDEVHGLMRWGKCKRCGLEEMF